MIFSLDFFKFLYPARDQFFTNNNGESLTPDSTHTSIEPFTRPGERAPHTLRQFNQYLDHIKQSTHQYNLQLITSQQEGDVIGDIQQERELIRYINNQ